MFTGLIEEIGKVKKIKGSELEIFCSKILQGAKTGDSIAVNGLCLSIEKIYQNYLSFHVSRETAERSRFKSGGMHVNESVNLERALTADARLGGHIVTGHVDGRAKIISIKKEGSDFYFEFLYPKELKCFIAAKGSVAIDGISLTISKALTSSFESAIIPQTLASTNLKDKKIGDHVHIEADIFARYIHHILLCREK